MYQRILGRTLVMLLVAAMVAVPTFKAVCGDEKIEVELKTLPADVLDKLPVHDMTLIDDTQPQQGQVVQPSYWLGVGVEPAADILRAHLPLPEGVGLTIHYVMPDSPAAKAGLKVHDILIEADGVSLKSQSDLVAAVSKAQDKKMRLSLLRRGDDIAVEATPGIRTGHAVAADDNPDFTIPGVEGLDGDGPKALQEWLQDMQQQGTGNARPFNFRVFGPAFKMRAGGNLAIPENLEIQIQRSGQEPAKIQVQRGDESWDITEDQLDQLPPDVRGHVQRMLGGQMHIDLPDVGDMPLPQQPLNIPGLRNRLDPQGFPKIQKRLDEMNQRMEQLFDRLEDLQQPKDGESTPDEE